MQRLNLAPTLMETMKNCAVIFGICSLSLAAMGQNNPSAQPVVSRTIYHLDDTRTESVSDPNTRELTEMTYNTAGQLTVKKVFLLNGKGEPMQGNVYDGRGNLVARCQSTFDELGRRKEDRLSNLQGQVFQHVIHEYGRNGENLPSKVINVDPAAAPMMKPQAVDYTTTAPMPNDGSSRFAPITPSSAGQAAQPQGGQNPTAAPEPQEKPKTNFFKKLFKKKD